MRFWQIVLALGKNDEAQSSSAKQIYWTLLNF